MQPKPATTGFWAFPFLPWSSCALTRFWTDRKITSLQSKLSVLCSLDIKQFLYSSTPYLTLPMVTWVGHSLASRQSKYWSYQYPQGSPWKQYNRQMKYPSSRDADFSSILLFQLAMTAGTRSFHHLTGQLKVQRTNRLWWWVSSELIYKRTIRVISIGFPCILLFNWIESV